MFIASKYEDITPLFMQTIVIRIGHHRFSRDAVLEQERDILNTLSFKMSAVPTVLEFLDRYILTHQYFKDYPLGKIVTVTKYLAYLQTHHIQFAGQKPSVVAASCLLIAHKLCKENSKFRLSVKESESGINYRTKCVKQKIIEISGCDSH